MRNYIRPTVLVIVYLLICISSTIGQSRKDSLYIFIGEKISVIEFQPEVKANQIIMDNAFRAKYKILQNVFGSYLKDTIEFTAYDHYGMPAFSKFNYVLLYVSSYNGKLYHEKYQFADVYKTKNGRWASSYKTADYEHPNNENTAIKPEPIEFVEQPSYSVEGRTKEDIVEWFPSPYYQIKGNKAIANLGNYVEELVELKKNGVLKARGIFD